MRNDFTGEGGGFTPESVAAAEASEEERFAESLEPSEGHDPGPVESDEPELSETQVALVDRANREGWSDEDLAAELEALEELEEEEELELDEAAEEAYDAEEVGAWERLFERFPQLNDPAFEARFYARAEQVAIELQADRGQPGFANDLLNNPVFYEQGLRRPPPDQGRVRKEVT